MVTDLDVGTISFEGSTLNDAGEMKLVVAAPHSEWKSP